MKEKIEKLLSEILSEKYDCVVRIRFEKKVTECTENVRH